MKWNDNWSYSIHICPYKLFSMNIKQVIPPTKLIMLVSYDDAVWWQPNCNVSRTSSTTLKSTEFLSRFKLNFRLKHNSTSGRMIYFMCQPTKLHMWPTKTRSWVFDIHKKFTTFSMDFMVSISPLNCTKDNYLKLLA